MGAVESTTWETGAEVTGAGVLSSERPEQTAAAAVAFQSRAVSVSRWT
jgi:hypothetical protein